MNILANVTSFTCTLILYVRGFDWSITHHSGVNFLLTAFGFNLLPTALEILMVSALLVCVLVCVSHL